MPNETIGSRIRRTRLRLHLYQNALAARAGITAPALSQIEHDKVLPNALHLSSLAVALGVSADYLLGITDAPRAS